MKKRTVNYKQNCENGNQTKDVSPKSSFVNNSGNYKMEFADILWIEGLKDYVKIHLKSSTKPVVTRMGMKTLEEQLPSSKFIRIHKSFL